MARSVIGYIQCILNIFPVYTHHVVHTSDWTTCICQVVNTCAIPRGSIIREELSAVLTLKDMNIAWWKSINYSRVPMLNRSVTIAWLKNSWGFCKPTCIYTALSSQRITQLAKRYWHHGAAVQPVLITIWIVSLIMLRLHLHCRMSVSSLGFIWSDQKGSQDRWLNPHRTFHVHTWSNFISVLC